MPFEIENIPFFHDLNKEEYSALKQCLIEKSYAKGEILHSEDASCAHLFFVHTGSVRLFRSSASGKEQVLEVLKAGDTCACNPGQLEWHCGSTAQALTPCTVWYLSRENYVRMVANNSKLMHALNELFAKRLQCFGDLIEGFTLKDSKKRLIKFLLDMLKTTKGKAQKDGVLFILSTREEMANRLGMARETVARQISELKRKKLIDVKPYQIIIRDREALEKLLQ